MSKWSVRYCAVCCLLLAIVFCFSSLPTLAQSTGTVSGTVADSSSGVVAGATVYLKDVASGSTRVTNTNDKGFFVFAYVNPGRYVVTVTKQGFKTVSVTDQTVEVGRQLTVNPVLEVGSVSSTVEVTYSPGAELQTMDATVGATLSGETLMNLPNTSRDASTLAVLQPGQNINGNVGGSASDQNSFTLDGGYATDDMSGDNNTYISSFSGDTAGGTGAMHSAGFNQAPSAVVPIPVASVEDFRVSTANQTADLIGGAGSQVQVVTKRGTNSVHGSVYDYYLDTNFGGANTWDNNLTGTKQPSSHFSRFGADAGGKIPHSNFAGGEWYLFGLYEGFRFPQNSTFERKMPLPSLRAGIIHDTAGHAFNLNPFPVVDPGCGTVNGTCGITTTGQVIQPSVCPAGPCDPRNLGTTTNGLAGGPTNPVITLWNTYLPLPNDCNNGDKVNYCGYKGTISTPQSSNFGVARIDHDFAKNWHFNGTYRYYKLVHTVSDQWDIGGFFPGDTKGQYAAIRQKPQNTWMYTAGVTTEIRPSLTNDFHFSYTRNWWAYADPGGVPNVAGYPAALEVGGENSGATSNPLFGPYNTNNQNVRTRFWNGHDWQYRDDVTWIKGNHVFKFGGLYLRNVDTHKRNDNGQGINTFEQYLIGLGNSTSLGGMSLAGYIPATSTLSKNKYGNLYSMVLGLVDETQGLFTRGLGTQVSGLPLNPIGSCAISGVAATSGCLSSPPVSATSILPTYSVYWSDNWRIKPKFSLNYGIGYQIEMPPYETTGGFQTVMVDQNDNIFSGEQYLKNVETAALQGQAYGPAFGFATVRNVNHHEKYPYDPYYGQISPRVGVAWNVMPNTVIRGGYARIFGRINGVNPLLVPLLTPGLLQPDTCTGPTIAGACGTSGNRTTPLNGFRVGVDGNTAPLPLPTANLAQPWFPGVNGTPTGSGETFDPNFKPNQSDEFTLTVQHQFGPKILAEGGYIGRRINHEIEYYGLGVVPYMMTLGGQSFANAWAKVMVETNYGTQNLKACAGAVTTGCFHSQPFFEAAINPAYCGAPGNCTAAFVANNLGNMNNSDAYDAWASVSNGVPGVCPSGCFNFGRTLTSDPLNTASGGNGQAPSLVTTMSNGYGNYHAGFLQLTFTNWHGLTMKTNFTISKALGTGNVVQATSSFATVDPWNLHNQYGPQSYDEKFNYNLFFNYEPPFYTNQKGVIGHLLGGWSFAPLFVYGSGFPVLTNTQNGCGGFGECNPNFIAANENLVFAQNGLPTGSSRHSNTVGTNCGTAGAGQNALSNPDVTCPANGGFFGDPTRLPILGLDGQMGGGGIFRGLSFWNLDLGIGKRIKISERFSGSLHFDFTNVTNHMQPNEPCFNAFDTADWGVLGCGGAVQSNTPRRLQLGITFEF